MKLDYYDLLSPTPYNCGIGRIISPTLRQIGEIHLDVYQLYVSFLLMTPKEFFKMFEANDMEELFNQRYETMVDIIRDFRNAQYIYNDVFNFFFVEEVRYNSDENVFDIYIPDETEEISYSGKIFKKKNIIKKQTETKIGEINADNFNEVCDIILQRCNLGKEAEAKIDKSKVKSKAALAILEKLEKGRQQKKQAEEKRNKSDKDLELGNLVAKVSARSQSLNLINIWDLTIFQFYETFRDLQKNIFFDMTCTSVSVYGDKDNKFIGNEWYKSD